MVAPFSFFSKKTITAYMSNNSVYGGNNDYYSYAYVNTFPWQNLAGDSVQIYYQIYYYDLSSNSNQYMYQYAYPSLPTGSTQVYSMYINYDFFYGSQIISATLLSVSPNPSTNYIFKIF